MAAETGDSSAIAIPPGQRAQLAWLLVLDAFLIGVFYVVYFPESFLAQTSAVLGLLTGLLGLLGFKLREERTLLALLWRPATLLAARVTFVTALVLLIVGMVRPFEIRTVPGADIFLDGEYHSTVPVDAALDEAGLSPVRIHTSWETHEFSVSKPHFAGISGESSPRERLSWLAPYTRPRLALPLRSCLGRAVEWDEPRAPDLDDPRGVGAAALFVFLRAINSLAGAGYPHRYARLPLSVQCGASVQITDTVVVDPPFSATPYLAVNLTPALQIRVTLTGIEPLSERIERPALELAHQVLRRLRIHDAEISERVTEAVRSESRLYLQDLEGDRELADLTQVSNLLRTDQGPCVGYKRSVADATAWVDGARTAIDRVVSRLERYASLAVARSSTEPVFPQAGPGVAEMLGVVGVYAKALEHAVAASRVDAALVEIDRRAGESALMRLAKAAQHARSAIGSVTDCRR